MSFPRTYKQSLNEWENTMHRDKCIIITVRGDCIGGRCVIVTRFYPLSKKAVTKVYQGREFTPHFDNYDKPLYLADEIKDYKVQAYIKFLCETTKSYPGLMYTLDRVVNGTPRFRDLRKGMTIKLEYNSPKMKYLGMSFPNKAYKFFVPSKNKEIYLDVRQFRNREVYSVDGFFGNTVPKEQKIDDMYMPVCKSVEDVMKELAE